jgi:hypothetical protein
MRRVAAALVWMVVVGPAAAQEWTHPSLAGSGLLTLPDSRTLAPGCATLAVSVDNRDRDPLGLDLLDGAVDFAVGLHPRLEVWGRAVLSRVASLPEPPPLPPPPLDLIVPPGAVAPVRPYYALHAPTPYVNKRGTARFDEWVPGDALLGLKLRLRSPSGFAPGLAASGSVKVPLTRSRFDLQSGSGTGAVDLEGRLTAEWRRGPASVITTAAYALVGSPAEGDRLLVASSASTEVVEAALRLADRVDVGLGLRYELNPAVAGVFEASAAFEVGSRSPTLDATWPLDLLFGVQARWKRIRATVALRYHGHTLPSRERRLSPLSGFVDLTDVAGPDLAAYLGALGAGDALSRLRPHAQRLLSPDGAVSPLPPGARIVPASYVIRSEHQIGYLLLLGVAF